MQSLKIQLNWEDLLKIMNVMVTTTPKETKHTLEVNFTSTEQRIQFITEIKKLSINCKIPLNDPGISSSDDDFFNYF